MREARERPQMASGRSSRALAEEMAAWAREGSAAGPTSRSSSQALANDLAALVRESAATLQRGPAAGGPPRRAATTASRSARAPAAQSARQPPPQQGAPRANSRQEDSSSSMTGPSGYNQNLSSSGAAQHDMRRQASSRESISKRNQRAIDAILAQDKQEEKDKQAADALLRHEDAIYAKEIIGREQAEASDRRAAAAFTRERDSDGGMGAGSASAPAGEEGGHARELESLYTRPGLAEPNTTTPSEHNRARSTTQQRPTTSTINEDRHTPQTFSREASHTPATTAAAAAAEDAWVQQLREIRAANEAVEASRRAASSSVDAERIAREVQRELDRIRRSDADNRRGTAPNPSASDSNTAAAPVTSGADVFADGMRDMTLNERRAAIRAHTLSRRGNTLQSSGAASVPSSPTTASSGLRRVATAPSTQPPRRPRTPPSPERLALLAELYEMEPREEPEIPFVRLIGDHDPPSVLAEFVADLDLAYPPPPRWHMDLRFNVHVRITADERRRVRFDVRVVVELEIRDV